MFGSNKNFITSNRAPQQARSTFRIPAVQALLIQCVAFPLSLVFAGLISFLTGWHVDIVVITLLQGVVAAVVAHWRGLAFWWVAIQLCFPCLLITVHALELPPWIFLAAFVFLLSLYWTTFRTQVPFYPSNPKVWDAVLTLLPHDVPIRLIDIGSGMGGGVLYMAARQPQNVFVGIEIAPLPWLISTTKRLLSRSKASFIRGNYQDLNLGDYDIVFAYLSPVAMPALWEKAKKEMRPGSLLLSYEFSIPGVPASMVLRPAENVAALYAWHI